MTGGTYDEQPERRNGVIAGLVLVAALLLFAWLFPYTAPVSTRLGLPLLLAVVAALACYGCGDAAYRFLHARFGHDSIASPPRVALFLVGYPLFGLLNHLLGLIVINVATAVVMLTFAVWGVVAFIRSAESDANNAHHDVSQSISATAYLIFGMALLFAFLLAQLPASTLDEVAYHLAVPKSWVMAGRIIELPLISHSYFPFAIESADIPLLTLLGDDGAIASHFLHLIAAIATVIAMLQFVVRHGGGSGAIHVAALATTPALLITAGWAWIDVPLVGLAVVLLDAIDELRFPALAALAIAGGLLTKYTFAPLALVFLIATYVVSDERRRLLRIAIAGAVGGSFFYLKNLVMTGNPFYPMFTGDSGETIGYRAPHTLALIPSYVYDRRFFDETLGVALFAFILIALFVGRKESGRRPLLWMLTALFVAVLILAPSSRILLPLGIPVALLGIAELGRSRNRLASLVSALVAIAQLGVVAIYTESVQPLSVLALKKTDGEYLREFRAHYPITQWADSLLPEGSRTLVLGSQELFWFRHDVRGGGNFDGPRLARYLAAPDPDVLLQRLRSDGFTHVVVIADGIRVGTASSDVKRRERELVLDAHGATMLQKFLRERTMLLSRSGSTTVHELKR